MENLWIWSVFIGTVFFVGGQICLRKSFETRTVMNHLPSLYTTACFSIIIGILGAILLMSLSIHDPISTKQFFSNSVRSGLPFLAGALFFIGFGFWIYSISSQNPLGMIRILMAGWEMLLLLLVGILIFKDKLHWTQLLGSLLIFSGIGSIIYSHSLTS
jgi:drug/metabolite transporter (DMT)-like permease